MAAASHHHVDYMSALLQHEQAMVVAVQQVYYTSASLQHELNSMTALLHVAHGQHTD